MSSLDCNALLSELGLDDLDQVQEDMEVSEFSQSSHKNIFDRYQTTIQNDPKIVVNVQTGPDQIKQFILLEGEDPQQTVLEFCKINNLDQKQYHEIAHAVLNAIKEKESAVDSQTSIRSKRSQITTTDKKRDVYTRLYQRAIMKQNQLVIEEDTSKYENFEKLQRYYGQNQSRLPPGERLYNFCQKKEQEKQVEIERFRQEVILEQHESLTFQPKINNKFDYKSLTTMKEGKKLPHYLQSIGKTSIPDLDSVANRDLFPFQPKIAEFSKVIVKNKRQKDNNNENVFNHLYNLSKQKNNSFMLDEPIPELSDNTPERVDKVPNDFLQRVQDTIDKNKQKLERLQEYHSKIDINTGKKLFQPQVGRPPKIGNQQERENIFDYLYNDAFVIKDRLNQQREEIYSQKELVKIGDRSDDLAFEFKQKKIKEIFQKMDLDQDGLVHCSYDELQKLPSDQQQIFFPLFNEISAQIQDDGIDFYEFFRIISEFIKNLTPQERYILLEKKEAKQDYSRNLTFVPKINQVSKQICQNKQDYSMCKCQVCRENILLTQLVPSSKSNSTSNQQSEKQKQQ